MQLQFSQMQFSASKKPLLRSGLHRSIHISPRLKSYRTLSLGAQATSSSSTIIQWLAKEGMTPQPVEPTIDGKSISSNRDCKSGDVLLNIPGSVCVTVTDVTSHDLLGAISTGFKSELVALAFWLMVERSRGASSAWAPLVSSLPERTNSPLLWTVARRRELLQGSPVLTECETQLKELEKEFLNLESSIRMTDEGKKLSGALPGGALTRDNFIRAFAVVLSSAIYLPSAQCFAIIPLLSVVRRSYKGSALIDYDPETGGVLCVSDRPLKKGDELVLSDQRPTREMVLTLGVAESDNPNNCLEFEAALVGADRLFTLKKQVIDAEGFGEKQIFPLFEDRFPTQLLSYMRLARLQDPGDLAKINFKRDNMASVANEYEVLMLVMNDCRDRLTAYANDLEEDFKLAARGQKLADDERLALTARLGEKKILRSTMDALRKRLTPIRGIPTKGGQMEDPNQDLREIFQAIEDIPAAPKKLFGNFLSWAKGEYDPDFNKKGGQKKR